MQKEPLFGEKAPSSVTESMHILQSRIADLYLELVTVEGEARANELIHLIRFLENELIDMRKAQPGYCLHI